jgi:hypothetical protein
MSAEPLPAALQVAHLRIRSITAGLPLMLEPGAVTFQLDQEVPGPCQVVLTRCDGERVREVRVELQDLLSLARLKADHPVRIPEPDVAAAARKPFDGRTFDPERDQERMGDQMVAVWKLMRDGVWRTLRVIRDELERQGLEATEAGVSARLRDLRKARYGEQTVQRENLGGGLWRYRVLRRGASS